MAAYATAADIAHTLGITTTLVYVWAHRDHWRRTRRRPRRYLLTDAQNSYDRRRGNTARMVDTAR